MGLFDDLLPAGVTTTLATTFADPADVERYRRAKAWGLPDSEAFKYGDNGIGRWGDNTTAPDDPIVALPRDDPSAQHNQLVQISGPGGSTIARVGDVMPKRENIKNGAGIDLNPAAASAIGATSGKEPIHYKVIGEDEMFADLIPKSAPAAPAADGSGMFDDLVPQQADGSGMFDDLVPQQTKPGWIQQELDNVAAQQAIEAQPIAHPVDSFLTGVGTTLDTVKGAINEAVPGFIEQATTSPLHTEPLQPNPDDSGLKATGKAAYNLASGFIEGTTSPAMIATFAAGAVPQLGRAVAGAFAGDIASHLPAAWEQVQAAEKTPAFSQERVEAAGNLVAQLGMLHGIAAHAARPGEARSGEQGAASMEQAAESSAQPAAPAIAGTPELARVAPEFRDLVPSEALPETSNAELRTPNVDVPSEVPAPAAPPLFRADDSIPFMTKQRMESAAREAGIPDEQLATMTTPEVSALTTRQPAPAPSSTLDVPSPEPVDPARAAIREPTPEQLAEAQYRAELLNEANASQAETGHEFLDALVKSGGLPSRTSAERASFSGEFARLDEIARDPQRTAKLPLNKLFRSDAPPPDELATRMRDRGFDIQTPADLFTAVEDRLRTGKPTYGNAAATAAADSPFGFGPGAASAKEPLVSYEKRTFTERLQTDYRLAQELRENTGDRYYEPIPNKITAEQAVELVNSRPVADTLNALRDEASGIPFHVRATMGQMLVKRLNQGFHNLRETDPAGAEVVLNHAVETSEWLSNLGTQLGQGVQAFSMWNRLTPEGKLMSLQRTVRKSRDRFTAENGDEVAEIIDKVNTEGMTDTQRLAELKKLFKTNATARKVKPDLQKLLETARTGRLTDEKFYDVAGERLGLPKWTPQTATEIMRLAAKIENAPEGMPRDAATFELSKFIATQKGLAARDLPIGIYYANMLSGYNTQIVNGLDTFLNVSSELTGLAAANPRAAAVIYRNALRGFMDGRLDFMQTLSSGRMVTDGKWLEVPKLMEIANFGEKGGVPINVKSRGDAVIKAISESRPAKVLNGWKYVGRLMAASDAFMFRGAYEGRMALLGHRVATTEGLQGRALDARVEELLGRTERQQHRFELQAASEGFTGREAAVRIAELRNFDRTLDARADAADFASLATYNHEPQGLLGYAAKGLSKAATDYPLLKLFVPFTRIVANVTNRGLNYTPLGFKRAFYGYERGSKVSADQRAQMLARATMGTLGMTTLLGMQAGGLLEINGGGPTDPERRRQLEAAGWRPYSLKIGNQYWSYAYTPIGLGLSILGNMTDSYRYNELEQKDALTRTTYAVSRIGSTVFSQSFLAGLNNLFQGLGKPEQSVPALKNIFATSVGAISTPRIILDVQRLFDPTRYASTTIGGDLLRNTPFAAAANQPAINAFGDPVTNPSNRFVSTLKPDPVWQLVVAKNLRVPVPDKYTEMPDGKGGRRRITPEEYYELTQTSGKLLKQYMIQHIPDFLATDSEKAQKALSEAGERSRTGILYRMRKRVL